MASSGQGWSNPRADGLFGGLAGRLHRITVTTGPKTACATDLESRCALRIANAHSTKSNAGKHAMTYGLAWKSSP
jgi:hypothetical protein